MLTVLPGIDGAERNADLAGKLLLGYATDRADTSDEGRHIGR